MGLGRPEQVGTPTASKGPLAARLLALAPAVGSVAFCCAGCLRMPSSGRLAAVRSTVPLRSLSTSSATMPPWPVQAP